MPNVTKNGENLLNFVSDKVHAGELDNDSLLELIKLCGAFLNLKTIPDYAKDNGLTYQGVKVTRRIETVFNVKFVIDNT